MDRDELRQRCGSMIGLSVWVIALTGMVAYSNAGNDSAGTDVAQSLAASRAPAASACASLTKLALPETAIASATVIPASSGAPEYCKVAGAVEGVMLFEVALPTTTWNGKFSFAGGGGYNGSIPSLAHLVARGYAAAGTDTGHQGSDMSWAINPHARINYGHRATHLVTGVAKEIVRAYYSQKEQRSYFVGCSNGGKMALMEIQRYPNDYDAAVVGNFVIDRSRLSMSYVWNAQALASAPIPPTKVAAIAKATLAACDGQDGLVDGVIDSPQKCAFDPKVLACSGATDGADGPDCLTPGQVSALEKIYAGPSSSAGQQLYPGFPPGHESDYPAYITGAGRLSSYGSSQWNFQDTFMRFFAFGLNYFAAAQFDFDKSVAALAPAAEHQDAAATDLSAFKARGGKVILYHGWADHSITPLRTVQYYEDVRKTHGAQTDEFVRLFMVAGLHHCTGGPGPNHFGGRGQVIARDDPEHDIVRALDRWVEQGIAPDTLVATKYVNDDPRQGVARTRPLCRYPQVVRYRGSGSIDDAANFVCAAP